MPGRGIEPLLLLQADCVGAVTLHLCVVGLGGVKAPGEVPDEVLLGDASTATSYALEESIEAALGGAGLPATIGDVEAVTYWVKLCDGVAMQADHNAMVGNIDTGVTRAPVTAAFDSLNHGGFDFTHDL